MAFAGRAAKAGFRPATGAERPRRQAKTVPPEELAAAGPARWPFEVVGGPRGLLWATICPRCGASAVGVVPPAPPFDEPFVTTACTGLGCPPEAVREAMRVVLERRPVPVGEDDARRLGRFLPRVLPDLWSGRTGRDPQRALRAARFTLEELGLRSELVELALAALARRRNWPAALVEAVIGREVSA